jgi:hypothetical protein
MEWELSEFSCPSEMISQRWPSLGL